ncbi:MAG TPA: class I SAM-dependent methyltransferase [Solirubrobacteraceae bacterium]|nr:class I SAM-dependent methyltransferase [Solirubrobacteraceae bacterium]
MSEAEAQNRAVGGARPRVPEPMVMHDPEAAAAFHRAGSGSGPLVPLYEVCARGIGKLLGPGGRTFDLGSGSGRFLAYLSRRRPDAELVGLELSQSMLELGERMLASEGLSDRVRLIRGDMTSCSELVPDDLGLISCMLALHQLPSAVELEGALAQVAQIRERTGCAIWLADIVRLQDDSAMQDWMAATPDPDPPFWQDAFASEAAGWTQAELTAALEQAGLEDLHHAVSPLLQVHWAPARGREPQADGAWQEHELPAEVRGPVIALRMAMRGLP